MQNINIIKENYINMTKTEFIERYGIEEYERKLEQNRLRSKQWREENKEYFKQYYQDNAEHVKEVQKQWYQENAEYIKEYKSNTHQGRANRLVQQYKFGDSKYNRGECTLTSKWIIDHIFNNHCIYCGESDWKKLGCDRIDNSKPHTEDNVVCSCGKCNVERGTMNFEEFISKINEKK